MDLHVMVTYALILELPISKAPYFLEKVGRIVVACRGVDDTML